MRPFLRSALPSIFGFIAGYARETAGQMSLARVVLLYTSFPNAPIHTSFRGMLFSLKCASEVHTKYFKIQVDDIGPSAETLKYILERGRYMVEAELLGYSVFGAESSLMVRTQSSRSYAFLE